MQPPKTIVTISKVFLFTSGGTAVIFGLTSVANSLKNLKNQPNVQKLMLQFQRNVFFEKKNIFYVLLGINAMVFLCWQIPVLMPVMSRWFLSSPYSAHPYITMFTSMFSHIELFHILLNMYGLYSFTNPCFQLMDVPTFLGLYLSGGLWAGFLSNAVKIIRKTPNRSLGASGAIFAVLAFTCAAYPNSGLSIAGINLIIPHSFTAIYGLGGLMALDTAGLLLNWKTKLDHAGHLGGALFGLCFAVVFWKFLSRRKTTRKP